MIPVWNEAESLALFLPTLPDDCEYLVIDDGSTDNSIEVAESLGFQLVRQNHKGKPRAVKIGFSLALQKSNFDAVVVMDGDGQHPASALPEIQDLLKNLDIVKASRFLNGWPNWQKIPFDRRVLYCAVRSVIQDITGWELTDPCCGLVGMQKKLLEEIFPLIAFDYEWELELILRLWGLKHNCLQEFSIPVLYDLIAEKQKRKYSPENWEERLANKLLPQFKKIITTTENIRRD